MRIEYQKVVFSLRFSSSVLFNVYPAFLFRSLLGMELRRISCLFGERSCEACSLKEACPYSFLFESPVEKENEAVAGRDRAGHPFALLSHEAFRERTDSCALELTLFGKAIDYLPYVFHALSRAGERGALRSRTKFAIGDAKVEGDSILASEGEIDTGAPRRAWTYGEASGGGNPARVFLLSPLRLKVKGRYTKDFSAGDFFERLYGRARMLALLYGDAGGEDASLVNSVEIGERNLGWMDLEHFSARQGRGMKMGGAIGDFSLEGKMDEGQISLLEFASVFHAGKNPSFGLGALEVRNG